VATILKTSAKSVIARFGGMAGVVVLPDAGEGKRKERDRYRQIRISKSVLAKNDKMNLRMSSVVPSSKSLSNAFWN
jgi:hypothetical protein